MKIRSRLFVLVFVLTLPSVLFAGWIILSAAQDLQRDALKLSSLSALQAIWTRGVMDQSAVAGEVYADFLSCRPEEPAGSARQAVSQAKSSLMCIRSVSHLSANRSQDTNILSEFVSGQLADLVGRLNAVVRNTERAGTKEELKHADSMSVLVGAGQFKALADRISQLTREMTATLPEGVETPFTQAATAYRQANGQFQGAMAKATGQIGQGMDGTQIDLTPVRERHVAFLAAIDGLHQVSLADVESRLHETLFNARLRMWGVIAGLVSVLLVAVGIAWQFKHSILRSIDLLNTGIRNLADTDGIDGDLPYANGKTEIAEISRAVGFFRDRTVELTKERQRLEGQATAERQERVECFIAAFRTKMDHLLKEVDQALETMKTTSTTMSDVAATTDQTARTTASSSSHASKSVNEAAVATEALAAAIAAISQQAHTATGTAETANQNALAANTEIDSLSEISKSISDIVSLINGIADQTNLLALNATIEAARAGEAGKGFEIVAGEVKALAGETASATQQISQQVELVQSRTDSVIHAIEKIISEIGEVTTSTAQIASDLEAKCQTTNDIKGDVLDAASNTQAVVEEMNKVEAIAQQSNQAAVSMGDQTANVVRRTEELREEINAFLSKVAAA